MQTKLLVDQMKEAQLLNKYFGWGMPDSFFQIDFSKIDLSVLEGKTKVLSFYLPGGSEYSTERTFKALISFIEAKAKKEKLKFSISEELRNPCGRIHYCGGCHDTAVEIVSFDCCENQDNHDGVVVGKIKNQAGTDQRFLSAHLLWAYIFHSGWNIRDLPKIAMAGYSFWPTRSLNDKPKTLVMSASDRELSIETVEIDKHIFSSVPRVKSSLKLLTA